MIVGGLWLSAGSLMLLGVFGGMRPLASFAAEFLLIVALIGCVTMLVLGSGGVALALQVAIGAAALAHGGFARLIDRAEARTFVAVGPR